MTKLRLVCFGFTAFLIFAVVVGHVPAFLDADGRTFGIFKLNLFNDVLHSVSALWALAAALTSHRAAKFFLTYFGILYFADGALGLLTGSGYLDLGIIRNGLLDLPFSFKIFANTPHLGLGGIAILSWLFLDDRKAKGA
jgi:Domain of unknown function (DUF4383)